MSNTNNDDKFGHTKKHLAGIAIVLLASTQFASNVRAKQEPPSASPTKGVSIRERIANARKMVPQGDSKNIEHGQDPNRRALQFYNFPNFGNWPNWAKWDNWNNWNNWHNTWGNFLNSSS